MHQTLTRQWWAEVRPSYQLFTSQVVIDEASEGDAEMVADRVKALDGITQLEVTPEAELLADAFLSSGVVPEVAKRDALHIAVACVYRLDYVLTWNSKHIANVHIQGRLKRIALSKGHDLPLLTTPEDMILSKP